MAFAEFGNLSPMMSTIVLSKLATLLQLQTVYSYEDAMDLYEAISIKNYNDWAATEASRQRQ